MASRLRFGGTAARRDHTVTNFGQIRGDVVLGSDTDKFVYGTGGSLTGMLFLGGGGDFVSIENASVSMTIADFVAGPAANGYSRFPVHPDDVATTAPSATPYRCRFAIIRRENRRGAGLR